MVFHDFSNRQLCALSGFEMGQVGLKLAQVGVKLASSWLKLASSWAQVGPRWPHAGSKWRQKSIHENMSKNITFRIASNSIFDRFWGPTWPPREGQNFHFWGLKTVLEPTWPPGAPRGSQDTPKTLSESQNKPIWDTFWSIFEPT